MESNIKKFLSENQLLKKSTSHKEFIKIWLPEILMSRNHPCLKIKVTNSRMEILSLKILSGSKIRETLSFMIKTIFQPSKPTHKL